MQRKGDYLVELGEYLKRNQAKGYTLESLKWALIHQGHSKIEVEKAIAQVKKETASKQSEPPTITYHLEPVAPPAVDEPKQSFWKRLFGKK